MDSANKTLVTEFILLGLSSIPEVEGLFFIIFLLIYMATLAGNILIITVILLDAHLQTAMYYFISNLSFLDCCCSSVTVPKMLADLLSERKTISFTACMIQLYFVISLVSIECLLLAAMAYDRFTAICHPLHYSSIMDQQACSRLAASLWIGGFFYTSVHVILMSRLSFCRSNEIQHFFCDIPPLLKLSCSSTFTNILVIFTLGGLVSLGALLIKIVSYTFIITTILNIKSSEGRVKAFSTCASHLTVVIIFYGVLLFTYFRPTTTNSFSVDRFVSMVYSILTPMVNPIIYSLRNTEMKKAVRKVIDRMINKCWLLLANHLLLVRIMASRIVTAQQVIGMLFESSSDHDYETDSSSEAEEGDTPDRSSVREGCPGRRPEYVKQKKDSPQSSDKKDQSPQQKPQFEKKKVAALSNKNASTLENIAEEQDMASGIVRQRSRGHNMSPESERSYGWDSN
ncbi:olfactory receptor 5AR1-like [Pleurodeles waltl]|uniref:olfactory receptor 5AR1-like n=1 Tax=Pleurodeles waltl TaxID=8319 RepID=UPI0037097BF6